ncbi:MAG: hypothetical protein F6J93_26945 [Oscillatoria sp. SIO1A7]|nr:hypothetical protein [Oscillatoria sp. SIO1A7]
MGIRHWAKLYVEFKGSVMDLGNKRDLYSVSQISVIRDRFGATASLRQSRRSQRELAFLGCFAQATSHQFENRYILQQLTHFIKSMVSSASFMPRTL